jgi:hypothetical protein
MIDSTRGSLFARGGNWRYPEFWVLWAVVFALVDWSWIHLELGERHVDDVGIGPVVAAALSLAAIAAPRQVRRTSALLFALVIAGGLIVLWASWRYFGIYMVPQSRATSGYGPSQKTWGTANVRNGRTFARPVACPGGARRVSLGARVLALFHVAALWAVRRWLRRELKDGERRACLQARSPPATVRLAEHAWRLHKAKQARILHVSLSIGRCTPAFDGAAGAFATSIRTAGAHGAFSMPVDLVGAA